MSPIRTVAFACLALVLLPGPASSDPGQDAWVVFYGLSRYSWDRPQALASDTDGNIYVTGSSEGMDTSEDYTTIKYDPEGNEIWTSRYNGPGNGHDRPAGSIKIDDQGNVYVTGSSTGEGTRTDYATVKYDPDGNEIWTARYDGPGNDSDYPYSMDLDALGNAYVTGASTGSNRDQDYATIKYDTNGIELWTARYNGPLNTDDVAFGVAVDHAGNVYVTGRSEGVGSLTDYVTVKYDPNGIELWTARYNGPLNGYDAVSSLAVDHAGNVCVTGRSEGAGTSSDYATIKYNPDGKEIWTARYNGPGNDYDAALGLAVDPEENVYVTGLSRGIGTSSDFATIKYDPGGIEIWTARYNGPGNDRDWAVSLVVDTPGNVYVLGSSYSGDQLDDLVTVKYDPDGVELWAACYNGPGNGWDHARALTLDPMGNVVVTGESKGEWEDSDYATIKYDPEQGNEVWAVRYNGPKKYSNNDFARAIRVDDQGNVYVTGWSWGAGSPYDNTTVKYDPIGNELWTAHHEDPEFGRFSPQFLELDPRGNVVVAGFLSGGNSSRDYAVVKYDKLGNDFWAARYNGPGNYDDELVFLAVDEDLNVYVTGSSCMEYSPDTGECLNYDYATIKYDPDGNELWTAHYDGPRNFEDRAVSLAVDLQGNVYVTGKSQQDPYILFDYLTVKYDPDGGELWVARYNGPDHMDDEAVSLVLDDQGTVYVTGTSQGTGTGQDYLTIKYDPDGNELWIARYNGPGNDEDRASSIALDPEGNLLVSGKSEGVGTRDDYATLKYNPDGDLLWTARYKDPEKNFDGDSSLAVDDMGNVYVTSRSNSFVPLSSWVLLMVIKYDSEGNEIWVARYSSQENGYDYATSVAVDRERNVYVTGGSCKEVDPDWGYCLDYDYLTLKNPQLICFDHDNDGFDGNPSPACSAGSWDCNDADPEVHPNKQEDCFNRTDDNCNDLLDGWDPDCAHTCVDRDGDGSGIPGNTVCKFPGEDCNDNDPAIHPGAMEDCFNRKEDDCNGKTDYTDPACGLLAEDMDPFELYGLCDYDRDGLTNRDELDLWWYTYGINDRDTILAYTGVISHPDIDPGDVDRDGLPDGLEKVLGTDPQSGTVPPETLTSALPDWDQDDDGDGLMNGLEVIVYKTNPAAKDTDGDGFEDREEIEEGSDPRQAGSVPGHEGVIVGTVKMSWASGRAPIGVNGVEMALYSEPGHVLMDRIITGPLFGRDGSFLFGMETLEQGRDYSVDVTQFPGTYNPLQDLPMQVTVNPYPPAAFVEILVQGFVDKDLDSVPDEVERQYGTLDTSKDTDGDGMPDGYEILHLMNGGPCCDPMVRDSEENSDGDEFTNGEERELGYDPNNPKNIHPCVLDERTKAVTLTPSPVSLAKVRFHGNEQEVEDPVLMRARSVIPGSVTGRVIRAVSGTGIPDASVTFYEPGCSLEHSCDIVAEVTSQENGIFWNILPSGTYPIKVCKSGYYPALAVCDIEVGHTPRFFQISLHSVDPDLVTPEVWLGILPEQQAMKRARSEDPYPGPRMWERLDGSLSRTVLFPLPVPILEDPEPAQSKTGNSVDPGMFEQPWESGGFFQLVFSSGALSGSVVSRVEPNVVAPEVSVHLQPLPGDAVTFLEPGQYEQGSDGRITVEDVLYGLGIVVGDSMGYVKSLDLVDTASGSVLRDEQGRLIFKQDGRVGIEDALAVLRGARGFLDLPDNYQDMRQPKAFTFYATETSMMSLFDEENQLIETASISGTAEAEILSFFLDLSGSAFRILRFDGHTGIVNVPDMDLVLTSFRVWMDPDQGEQALGTIVRVTEAEGVPVYSFQIDNFYINVEILFLGLIPVQKIEDIPWEARGSFTGGEAEGEAISIHTGFSELMFTTDSSELIGVNFLVDLESLPGEME